VLPPTSIHEAPQAGRELGEVKRVGGDRHDQVDDVAVGGCCRIDAVDVQEHGARQPPQPLVPVDHRVVLHDRVEQGGGLRPQVRVGVLAEGRGTGTGGGSSEKSHVADGRRVTEQAHRQGDEVVDVEVLDVLVHRPRRSRASAWASMTRAAEATTPSGWSSRPTYSRMARRGSS
jgi:hypothetical protein